MCGEDGNNVAGVAARSISLPGGDASLDAYAEFLSNQPERSCSHVGFIGYGATQPNDRVLLAVDTSYDESLVKAVRAALQKRGASVDLIVRNIEEDRELDERDEIEVLIRREPYHERRPRRYEGVPEIEHIAEHGRYDLLIHGKGGPTLGTPGSASPEIPYRYEQIPWIHEEQFLQRSTVFPQPLHDKINRVTWKPIWEGKGGRVHMTDPEGTDITWTQLPEYYTGRRGIEEDPVYVFGHLLGHGRSPIPPIEDATGVIAGTTSHISRPFPQIKVYLEGGLVTDVEGGGEYGAAWREIIQETKNVQYPLTPRPGLFWFIECAIGTNPKIERPTNMLWMSSGGPEWERRRSGIIHCGFGTNWRGPAEVWAGERGLPYGHLHVHLLFPTYKITSESGKTTTVIENGRLTSLDSDPVRRLAEDFGDPADLLTENWIPEIPGISSAGSYSDYAKDPAAFIRSQLESQKHAR